MMDHGPGDGAAGKPLAKALVMDKSSMFTRTETSVQSRVEWLRLAIDSTGAVCLVLAIAPSRNRIGKLAGTPSSAPLANTP